MKPAAAGKERSISSLSACLRFASPAGSTRGSIGSAIDAGWMLKSQTAVRLPASVASRRSLMKFEIGSAIRVWTKL
jgi:hypothetical protein